MATDLKTVKPGDPLVIPAATYNAFVDAARAHRGQLGYAAGPVETHAPNSGVVPVKNVSGQDQPRFAVLGITGPLIKPTENPTEFYGRVVLKAGVPQDGHVARFVVLLEPLKANAFGRACVSGVCVVKVKMNAETDGYAEVKTGQTDKLESAAAGSAVLVWVQPQGERSDPTVAWTIANLGGGGGLTVQNAIITALAPAKAKLYGPTGAAGPEFQLWGWNFQQANVIPGLTNNVYPALRVGDVVPVMPGTFFYALGQPTAYTGYFCLFPFTETVCT